MSIEVIGVLAGAGVALLTAIGAGLWKIITLILKTYKDQASATVEAKDAEVGTLRRDNTQLNDRVISELSSIREELGELRQDVWTLRRDGPR